MLSASLKHSVSLSHLGLWVTNCGDKAINIFLLSALWIFAVIASEDVELPILEVLGFVVGMVLGCSLGQ